jgi:hypothetical protein
MKYIITENRLLNLVHNFTVSQLGKFIPGRGSIVGKFYSIDDITAIIYFQNKKVFVDMDGRIYDTIKSMFSLNSVELDEILFPIFSEIASIKISEIYPVTPFP